MLSIRSRARLRLISYIKLPKHDAVVFERTLHHAPHRIRLHARQRPLRHALHWRHISLVKRVWQHREGFVAGFTKQYQIKYLVWYETHEDIVSAITREKQLKEWKRDWKLRLIHELNPLWRDLYLDLV